MKPALFDAMVVVAQRGNWGDGHHDWDDGWGIVMMIGMIVFMVILVVLVVVGIVWLVHSLRGGVGPGGGREPTPLELLDRLLAEGAVSVEEYERRRQLLLGSSPREDGGS